MAYPPVIPPNTRSNATDMVDSHASDHNALADALTAMLPTAWTALPLGAGMEQYPGLQPCQYRKEGDIVRVRGVVRKIGSTNFVNGDVFAILPVGFRPAYGAGLLMSAGGLLAAVGINPDGNIVSQFPPAGLTSLQLFGVVAL